ncbi:hypothetical protein OHB53_01060 [Streptomyces sp. NBC_00056]
MTQEFDRILLEGTLLEQAMTPNPVWAPARSALLTPPARLSCEASGGQCQRAVIARALAFPH